MQAGDGTLIEASRRGDRDAFAQIIERYQRAVYAVAFSGVRDRALADDVAQDTFVIAWRRLAELRDEQRLAAWLCGIARNRARDMRRQAHRETVGDVDDVTHATTPYDQMTEAESERAVAAALALVPDVYREPLVLYYYEERSIADVARSLGISAATTNKRLSRGRRYLAERVATVERGLARRGPRPGFAASVLALVGVTASASHVDASPAVKGSTMHKLAIAAAVTATLGGAAALVLTTTHSDAHAEPHAAAAHAALDNEHAAKGATAAHSHDGSLCDVAKRVQAHAPSLAPLIQSGSMAESNDCAAVGRHLAELQADTTHGPNAQPDEESFETCGAHYAANCESEHWSVDQRNCTLAAGDLINAHLCAGQVPQQAPTSVPANLSCAVLGPQIAATIQAAGMHEDVTDLPQQVEAACDVGSWSMELRTCFAAASSIDTLKGCFSGE
ncbi:MAG TPA: sigma-70 family RNA polymerase sigma factor [Kofleriaceae bacterium]|nr:sigma-70 family RNA polymerase sigma factor [Kofleriaceae bacterium]